MPETTPERNAYALLSKPTLELTDADVEIIVADLRKRRLAYATDPKKSADNPTKVKPQPISAAEKQVNTDDLLASLDISLGLK